MIIIPSRETVVLLVPRTGSGSLKTALLERYPDAFMLYRHMEADGVPAGYDRWRRLGVLRHPLDRLWSLYTFCKPGVLGGAYAQFPDAIQRLNASVCRPFDEWLLTNDLSFTNPFCGDGSLKFFPEYNVRHSMPENRKSQFHYLRPDLGTTIVPFERLDYIETLFDIQLPRKNRTGVSGPDLFDLSPAARNHIERFHAWDLREWGRHQVEGIAA